MYAEYIQFQNRPFITNINLSFSCFNKEFVEPPQWTTCFTQWAYGYDRPATCRRIRSIVYSIPLRLIAVINLALEWKWKQSIKNRYQICSWSLVFLPLSFRANWENSRRTHQMYVNCSLKSGAKSKTKSHFSRAKCLLWPNFKMKFRKNVCRRKSGECLWDVEAIAIQFNFLFVSIRQFSLPPKYIADQNNFQRRPGSSSRKGGELAYLIILLQ